MEKSKNKRNVIADIFSPALISGINTIFVPIRSSQPGQPYVEEETIVVLSPDEKEKLEEETIVVLSPDEKEKLPGTVKELIDLIKLITGEDIRVEFR